MIGQWPQDILSRLGRQNKFCWRAGMLWMQALPQVLHWASCSQTSFPLRGSRRSSCSMLQPGRSSARMVWAAGPPQWTSTATTLKAANMCQKAYCALSSQLHPLAGSTRCPSVEQCVSSILHRRPFMQHGRDSKFTHFSPTSWPPARKNTPVSLQQLIFFFRVG